MKIVDIAMIRRDLEAIPQHDLPAGIVARTYRPGDELSWQAIQAAADKLNAITPELFQQQFGTDEAILAARQFYLLRDTEPVATATAWYGDAAAGRHLGRVHWVAVLPEEQGKGLSKPLMALVCNRLRELGHGRAYLTTSTGRIPAVNLYLQFGFSPWIRSDEEAAAWQQLEGQLRQPWQPPRRLSRPSQAG